VIVRTSDDREIELAEGEILVELRNGNYLKGRLHKVTHRELRLAMPGGYVDVELSRLRSAFGEGEPPCRSIESYPIARVRLKTGEVLRGRLLRSTEQDVELVFPSGRIVLRRDMVRYVDRR
jgi:small nuclear ribonucleoprotein (snRNP)-like protein